MALFTWNNKYSVNSEELDNHHKALFGILNDLYESCFNGNERVTLERLYEKLLSYTNYHFISEEQHMRNIKYPDIESHIKAHNIFKERILLLQKRIDLNKYELDNLAVTKELIVYLGNWLLNHVLIEDIKYSIY